MFDQRKANRVTIVTGIQVSRNGIAPESSRDKTATFVHRMVLLAARSGSHGPRSAKLPQKLPHVSWERVEAIDLYGVP